MIDDTVSDYDFFEDAEPLPKRSPRGPLTPDEKRFQRLICNLQQILDDAPVLIRRPALQTCLRFISEGEGLLKNISPACDAYDEFCRLRKVWQKKRAFAIANGCYGPGNGLY